MAEVGEEEERTGADEAAGNSTTDDRKRKRSASPAGRTEDILPLLKKLASPEFDHIPTNEEVILTDLVGSSIITAEPPVEKVKKNMSTPVDNEWEWEVIIAEENNEEGEWEEIVAEENNEEWEWEEIIAEENNEDCRYEMELTHPIQNLLGGELVCAMQSMLIPVQKLKLDIERAMLELDQILRANEINFAILAALPAFFLSLILIMSVRGWLKQDTRAEGRGRVACIQRRLLVVEVEKRITKYQSYLDQKRVEA
ncbi:hypothetical protein SLEP1_g58626 [Rubroshorea leprosula]|uniref:Uncharacterized protein n=1 Tax=Rubroshorea leprosula TaxID=152421 RepID=A0AAV5MUG0_9ROSI|nr:hypothetical protein SLEP1_g58626 [Rubroshorea leprosula]